MPPFQLVLPLHWHQLHQQHLHSICMHRLTLQLPATAAILHTMDTFSVTGHSNRRIGRQTFHHSCSLSLHPQCTRCNGKVKTSSCLYITVTLPWCQLLQSSMLYSLLLRHPMHLNPTPRCSRRKKVLETPCMSHFADDSNHNLQT